MDKSFDNISYCYTGRVELLEGVRVGVRVWYTWGRVGWVGWEGAPAKAKVGAGRGKQG